MFTTQLKSLAVLAVCALAFVTTPLAAQERYYQRGYGGEQATWDAYARGEAQRVEMIDRMLNRIDQMRWYRGLPPRTAGPYADRYPPSLSYAYATGRLGTLGASAPRYYAAPYDIFTPWPYVPGDIWGFPDVTSVPQSIGQRQLQTGPNRWESHPVYRGPVEF